MEYLPLGINQFLLPFIVGDLWRFILFFEGLTFWFSAS